jgi:hypothetical protein
VFAVIAGLLFAIPFAGMVAAEAGGAADARPVLWHPLHAVAGVGFALALVELRRRYLGWFLPRSRIALSLAIASALALALGSAGWALGQVFAPAAPLYYLGLFGLSAGLVATGLTTRTLPSPLPELLVATGIAFPATLVLAFTLPPLASTVALMGYGLLWSAFGFVQLSRTP